MLNELRGHPFPTQVSEAWIRGRARGQRKLDPEDFPVLKEAALELQSTYPPETIVEAVISLARSDDPPHALPVYVQGLAAA